MEKCPRSGHGVFFRMMTEALIFCHQNCVSHRDVKPENMLVNDRDEVKLSDFGFARIHTKPYRCDAKDMSCELVGWTLPFAAPELFFAHFDRKPYDDFIADVWSLGVCLYTMLAGALPYSSGPDTPAETQRDLLLNTDADKVDCSQEALALLYSLLEKDPARRMDLRKVPSHPWLARRQGQVPDPVAEGPISRL